MIHLENRDLSICLDPEIGGSVRSAKWRGLDILRPQQGSSVLGSACFPLVPFSNRIAHSRFDWDGASVELLPNHPGDASSPVIHGFGWLKAWRVAETTGTSTELVYDHEAGCWPWHFTAAQSISLSGDGFELQLSLENRDKRPMPAGLGFHPYFPRSDQTVYRGLHAGEWQNDTGCIPAVLTEHQAAKDWWDGSPVGTRLVDTVYTKRAGPLKIEWPDRGFGIEITPSPSLPFTTIYVPEHEDFFCAEPVSHMTDAFNRDPAESGLRVLAPDEKWSVSMSLRAFSL